MSTMGWPFPEDFPETDRPPRGVQPHLAAVSTAREIITLWVSRMVMFNRYFMDGRLPFEDVFIHAMVQDGHGQKMSKSLGNGVDPRDIIFSHGADAMRFALVQMTTDTQDVRMPVDMVCAHTGETFTPEFITTSAGHVVAAPVQKSPSGDGEMVSVYGDVTGLAQATDERPLARNTSSKFDLGRNFANKVWNATRFALRRLEGAAAADAPVDLSGARFIDRWIVARLHQTLETLDHAIANYQFNVVADTLYDFVWHDVCDRYLEAIKPTVDDDPTQQAVLGVVLDTVLRIMHPVTPFVTEALWPHVSAARPADVAGVSAPPSDLLATGAWPSVDPVVVDKAAPETFDRAAALIGQVRALRSDRNVKPRQLVTLHVPPGVAGLIEETGGIVQTLAGIGDVVPLGDDRPAVASPLAFEGEEVLVSGLVDEADTDAERARLNKLIEAKQKQINGFEGKLANEGYVNNAKPEMVQETRDLLAAAQADLTAAEHALAGL